MSTVTKETRQFYKYLKDFLNKHYPDIFTEDTKKAFSQYLTSKPSNLRIIAKDLDETIKWLIDDYKCPKDQSEHSRRNYVRRIFQWDTEFKVMYHKKENIFDSGICSVCNKDLMHSYRAEKQEASRNIAIIEL